MAHPRYWSPRTTADWDRRFAEMRKRQSAACRRRYARRKLVDAHLWLPPRIAHDFEFSGRFAGLTVEDLEQEGVLGLMRAARRWSGGGDFTRWARRWIRGHMQRALAKRLGRRGSRRRAMRVVFDSEICEQLSGEGCVASRALARPRGGTAAARELHRFGLGHGAEGEPRTASSRAHETAAAGSSIARPPQGRRLNRVTCAVVRPPAAEPASSSNTAAGERERLSFFPFSRARAGNGRRPACRSSST
jgi:RNA polymerase sigma factor (sigma-70 family)